MNHSARKQPRTSGAGALLALVLLSAATGSAAAQHHVAAPFATGEILTYRAVSGRFGTIGTGTMRVDGPMDVRGTPALQLSFDFRGRVGIFKVEDRTRSWIATDEMKAFRFERRERSPLGSKSEEVDIFPDAGNWLDADGRTGETACEHPLDELSFLYYMRTLPLEEGEQHVLVHHFDPGRNPVTLRVLGRETITVPAGEFATVLVEMTVSDKRVSTMRLYLTDDAARIPVRIESAAPWVGSTRLLLESVSGSEVPAR